MYKVSMELKKNPLQPLNWIDSYKLQGFDIVSF